MGAALNPISEPADRVLKIERVFDAPRSLVFKAWTEPEHIAKWWGPRGFTSTVLKNDLRAGGAYRIHMRGPERRSLVAGRVSRIRTARAAGDGRKLGGANGNPTRPETTVTLLFEDVGGKTRLTLHNAIFESTTARDMHNSGWSSALDCLGEYLASVR